MKRTTSYKDYIKFLLPPFVSYFLIKIKDFFYFFPYAQIVKTNEKYRDIHKGKRCFILGSGPSINDYDLSKLKNEIIIGLNSFYIHDQYNEIFTSDCPKYMISAPIHDPQSEEFWKKYIVEYESKTASKTEIFFGLNNYRPNIKQIVEKYSLFKNRNVNWFYCNKNIKNKIHHKDIDFTKNIISASTSSVWGILLAIFMGFEEIYILGIDNNNICLPRDNQRFKEGGSNHDESKGGQEYFSWNYFTSFHLSRTLKQYYYIKMIQKGKIYNCSKISMADMFPFRDFNDL